MYAWGFQGECITEEGNEARALYCLKSDRVDEDRSIEKGEEPLYGLKVPQPQQLVPYASANEFPWEKENLTVRSIIVTDNGVLVKGEI